MKNCINCQYLQFFDNKKNGSMIYPICPRDGLNLNKVNGDSWDESIDFCSKFKNKVDN